MSSSSSDWIDFEVKLPYPKMESLLPNHNDAAAMLDNLSGQISEMGAVSSYFYGSLVLQQHKDVSQVFHRISLIEMHHMQIFGSLALDLGEDPRLWTDHCCQKYWWSPARYPYTMDLIQLLQNALQAEQEAIQKYKQQIREMKNESISEMLKRIILDEESHVSVLRVLLQKYRRCM